ncbi:PilX N-terminal domain-containing pilus assembly protein [Dechloromonas sp. TW-R-39-2]|uniref:pilus assembly PilX family protein n=1 Tax=Dechloromonas sp. TW-R-39-2 TaxID=2654218 RepID=UPI00193D0656|nr:PilX N-terminal domain-containing pilus assembly protein [Dechloromonas sp. TW-R-39-2]
MNRPGHNREQGFALIFSMLTLLLLTIIVVNSVRTTTMNEQMAGSYMDRNRAYQAAELALRQGEALLSTHADLCLTGCLVVSTGTPTANTNGAVDLPPSFTASDAGTKVSITATTGGTDSSFKIRQLSDAHVPSGKSGCKAYSIMGEGKGIDTRTAVVLQTVAFMCPI